MAAPATNNTMFNYFTKLPSKDCIVEENPRKLAPIFNKQHVDEFQARLGDFDSELLNNDKNHYLSTIKSGQHQPFKIDRKCLNPKRAKLLQFREDVRPPYYGTWQKTSRLVTGRRPFGLDEEIFDYDNDSEAEWDIGGPGESLKDDDSEYDDEDEGKPDDYEIDMKVFVPHGYVSEDELEVDGDNDERGVAKMYSNHSKPIIVGLNFATDQPDDSGGGGSVSERGAIILKSFEGQLC